MTERRLRQRLDAMPADREAEDRAWAVVRAAYAEREPARNRRFRLGLALAAAGVAVAAAALSPPGRAVVDAVRRSIGIPHAAPGLFRLPAPGRLLASGPGGTWVVAADGSKRRLGDYRQAAWSPHALYVAAAGHDEVAALDPAGGVHWSLGRPGVSFPGWGGSRTDTRISYLSAGRLRVVGGDGTGDRALGFRVAPVAPAWRPGDRRMLAFVTAAGRVALYDVDRGTVVWRSPPFAGPRLLAWSEDGTQLALATATELVRLRGDTGSATVIRAPGIRALAFAHNGRLAFVRRGTVVLVGGTEPGPLFTVRGTLSGLAWSPDGRWLLTALPGADQWIFVQTRGGRRVLAVSHIEAQLRGPVSIDGWR